MGGDSDFEWHPIPSSESTCKVYLIQAGGLTIPKDLVLLPGPDQHQDQENSGEKSFYAPDYVFLIEHSSSGNKYVFDLGIRKDLENLPPTIKKNVLPQFECSPKSPSEILKEHGTSEQQPEKIRAFIFSHQHFDHVGDGAKAGFTNAELWIGPTTCTYARPGYPVEKDAPTLSETLPTDGSRKIVEAYIPDELLNKARDKRAGKVRKAQEQGLYDSVTLKNASWVRLGAFDRAFDLFGDGAAYLVDAPGHSAGHQMLLVRTAPASSGDEFVLLAGDCFHHRDLLREPRRMARSPYAKAGIHTDPEQALDTIFRTREFALRDEVWVLAAHDFSVGESIQPGVRVIEGLVEVNGWKKKGWKDSIKANL